MPSQKLSDRLAGEYSVMLAPGSAFGYEGYLRIGIGQRPDLFREGLAPHGCLSPGPAIERATTDRVVDSSDRDVLSDPGQKTGTHAWFTPNMLQRGPANSTRR